MRSILTGWDYAGPDAAYPEPDAAYPDEAVFRQVCKRCDGRIFGTIPACQRKNRRHRRGVYRHEVGLCDVGGAHDAEAATVENVRVNLSRGDICVPQQLLDRTDVVAGFEKLGRKTVA